VNAARPNVYRYPISRRAREPSLDALDAGEARVLNDRSTAEDVLASSYVRPAVGVACRYSRRSEDTPLPLVGSGGPTGERFSGTDHSSIRGLLASATGTSIADAIPSGTVGAPYLRAPGRHAVNECRGKQGGKAQMKHRVEMLHDIA